MYQSQNQSDLLFISQIFQYCQYYFSYDYKIHLTPANYGYSLWMFSTMFYESNSNVPYAILILLI